MCHAGDFTDVSFNPLTTALGEPLIFILYTRKLCLGKNPWLLASKVFKLLLVSKVSLFSTLGHIAVLGNLVTYTVLITS